MAEGIVMKDRAERDVERDLEGAPAVRSSWPWWVLILGLAAAIALII
jgi:hypothetical protein